MTNTPHVTIVLPCYNEQDHVIAEVERICEAMDHSGYTYELAGRRRLLHRRHPGQCCARPRRASRTCGCCAFHRNGGSGTVRRIGTQEARGEIVVWTDADMTYPNERIPELVQILEKDPTIDQVVGARTSEEGTHKFLRVPAKWFIRKMAERLAGQKIPDLNSGLRAFRKRGAPAVPAAAAARVLLRHDDHAGVPVQPARRPLRADRATPSGPARRSSSFVSDAYRYILQVLRMVMYFNPLKVLMPPALWLVGIGVVKGVVRHRSRHPVLVASNTVMIFLSGLIIGSLALLADLIVRSRSEYDADRGRRADLPVQGRRRRSTPPSWRTG